MSRSPSLPPCLTLVQHCRKCGGVFCGPCTSRTTALLDASNLAFLHPPRNIPIAQFESPESPIVDSRVCDDCWDQIHGCPTTPHTPDGPRPSFARALSHPISMFRLPLPPASPLSGSATSDDLPQLRQKPSISSLDTQSSSSSAPPRPRRRRLTVRTAPLPLPQELERSYGELDAYPLRRCSVLCKATGGGRWEPKPFLVLDGYRLPVPGGKAPFEIQMEREQEEERIRKSNPIIRDGAFQYRFCKEPEPENLARSLDNPSTF